MKINVEVDCTPAEARAFLGLPDVTPLNDAMVAEMQKMKQRHSLSLKQPNRMRHPNNNHKKWWILLHRRRHLQLHH